MDVVDKAGKTHKVEPGEWWWADLGDGPEAVRVSPYHEGVVAGGYPSCVPFSDVVLLEATIPYAAAVRTRRDVVLDPIPGDVLDTHLFDTHLYRVRVDKVEGGTVFATETWYDGATFAQNLSLGGWSRMLGGPRGRRFEVTPAWGSTVPCRAS